MFKKKENISWNRSKNHGPIYQRKQKLIENPSHIPLDSFLYVYFIMSCMCIIKAFLTSRQGSIIYSPISDTRQARKLGFSQSGFLINKRVHNHMDNLTENSIGIPYNILLESYQ